MLYGTFCCVSICLFGHTYLGALLGVLHSLSLQISPPVRCTLIFCCVIGVSSIVIPVRLYLSAVASICVFVNFSSNMVVHLKCRKMILLQVYGSMAVLVGVFRCQPLVPGPPGARGEWPLYNSNLLSYGSYMYFAGHVRIDPRQS